MLLGAHIASTERLVEGYSLHRAKQCGQIVADKYADSPQGVGKSVGYTG